MEGGQPNAFSLTMRSIRKLGVLAWTVWLAKWVIFTCQPRVRRLLLRRSPADMSHGTDQ